MRRKEQYADEIIKMLERTKGGAWASNINLNTKDRVIEVCQNCVYSWSGRKFKNYCTTPPQALEQTRWIPVSERYPEDGQRVLVDYCDEDAGIMLIRFNVNGYRGFKAWMPLPERYKASPTGAESEVGNANSD